MPTVLRWPVRLRTVGSFERSGVTVQSKACAVGLQSLRCFVRSSRAITNHFAGYAEGSCCGVVVSSVRARAHGVRLCSGSACHDQGHLHRLLRGLWDAVVVHVLPLPAHLDVSVRSPDGHASSRFGVVRFDIQRWKENVHTIR